MKCLSCKHQLKPNAAFCGKCGTAIAPQQAKANAPPQEFSEMGIKAAKVVDKALEISQKAVDRAVDSGAVDKASEIGKKAAKKADKALVAGKKAVDKAADSETVGKLASNKTVSKIIDHKIFKKISKDRNKRFVLVGAAFAVVILVVAVILFSGGNGGGQIGGSGSGGGSGRSASVTITLETAGQHVLENVLGARGSSVTHIIYADNLGGPDMLRRLGRISDNENVFQVSISPAAFGRLQFWVTESGYIYPIDPREAPLFTP